MSTKKILVTGSRGLVGSQFIGEEYKKIGSSDLDLINQNNIDDYFNHLEKIGNLPEGIIHCAAKVGGIQGNMDEPGKFFYENILMNTSIIESARKFGIKKFIGFLSTCVFPDDVEYPLTPDKIHLGPPHPSNYAYAYAKRMAEVQMKAYRDQYGLNYFGVIPCNIYGPNDNYNLESGHVIPMLIHKMYLAKKNNTEFKVWGSGKSLREFIFSEDVAKLTRLLYDHYAGTDPLILSTSEEISIESVVEIISNAMEFQGEIIFDKSKPDGQYRKPSDNSVIKSMFPDFEFTPIRDGIKKSVEWFIQNYPNIRK
jgi:GDP-L-fucose synthase